MNRQPEIEQLQRGLKALALNLLEHTGPVDDDERRDYSTFLATHRLLEELTQTPAARAAADAARASEAEETEDERTQRFEHYGRLLRRNPVPTFRWQGPFDFLVYTAAGVPAPRHAPVESDAGEERRERRPNVDVERGRFANRPSES